MNSKDADGRAVVLTLADLVPFADKAADAEKAGVRDAQADDESVDVDVAAADA